MKDELNVLPVREDFDRKDISMFLQYLFILDLPSFMVGFFYLLERNTPKRHRRHPKEEFSTEPGWGHMEYKLLRLL